MAVLSYPKKLHYTIEYEILRDKNENGKMRVENVGKEISTMENSYVLVKWKKCQWYMLPPSQNSIEIKWEMKIMGYDENDN